MFTPQSGASNTPSGNGSLIPHGTLAFAVVKVNGLKQSKRTGGEYANLEFTISDGPFTNRKVWSIVMNPQDSRNINQELRNEGKSDGASMGLAAMTRMFEAAGVFNALDARTYQRFDGAAFTDVVAALEGLTVAIKIKIAKGKDGYDDKNEVAEFLSPAPTSGTVKLWTQLTGDGAAARKGAFGAFQQPTIQPPIQSPIAAQRPTNQITSGPKWITKRANGDLGLDNSGNNPY